MHAHAEELERADLPGNRKGFLPFGRVLRTKQGNRTAAEFAKELGIVENTLFKLTSGVIVPGVPTLRSIIRKYPDLYALGVEAHLGRRPRSPIPVTNGNPVLAFAKSFKELQGDRGPTEYAAQLGINVQSLYRVAWGKPVPSIGFVRRLVDKLPALYDLGAAIHFGPRPDVKQMTWREKRRG